MGVPKQLTRLMRFSTQTVTVLVLALTACGDDQIIAGPEEEPQTPGTCEQDFECEVGFEYRRGACLPSRCTSDADCCPGQLCSVAVGLCVDQTVACATDADCATVAGQACIDFRGGRFCGYPNRTGELSDAGTQSCDGPADCADGRTCLGRRCITVTPCGGGCPNGQVCDLDTDTCFDEPSCETTCTGGEILVVADPDLMSGPMCCAVECACAVLPAIEEGQLGWFTDLAADEDQLVASGYDPVYGDLVVGYFSETGTRVRIEYVDGFPDSGPVVGAPSGPRGGRIEPGPTVGEHTSVAIDATGTIHVAYYDRDEGRLKYAYGGEGAWTTSVVDDNGNTGLYTSIAIDPDGRPRIAYMMAEGSVGADPILRSGLKVATASVARPTSTDWTINLVDQRALPPPPCGGDCPDGELCTDLDTDIEPACFTVSSTTACNGCAPGESCVEIATNSFGCASAFEVAPNDDLLPGVGLFASLAITSTGQSVVAYYDRLARELRLAIERPTGGFGVRSLDERDPNDPTRPDIDAGQHASVAIGPDDLIAVAYVDATYDDLIYYDVNEDRRVIVDDGVSPPDLRFVGADADLVFDASGEPTIAYQDPTRIDLLFARRVDGEWTTEVIRGDSDELSAGFYATQAHRGTTAFVGGVDVDFTDQGDLRLELVIIPRPL